MALVTPSPLEELRAIVARLRAPDGCPWDREQTHASLRAAVLEEAYEVAEAIDTGDDANLREELGDLLLQTVFHAQLAEEDGRFNFDDVARGIAEKLVRRHPHVFGDTHCEDAAAVLVRWDEIKRAEKGSAAPPSLLDGIPQSFAALLRAEKVQVKAAKAGFDWDSAEPVFAKVREELGEAEAALCEPAGDVEDEIGDVLFAAVNLARKLKVNAEVALARSTRKFIARFQAVEVLAAERGLVLKTQTPAQLDALWEEVKARS